MARALDSSPGGPEFECRSHHYLILGHSNTSFKSKATLYNFELASVAKSIRSPYCRLKFTSYSRSGELCVARLVACYFRSCSDRCG